MHLWRPDRAQVASVRVATDKARTAALYRRPSKEFEDQAAHGRPSALHLARAVPLQGGVPIVHGGQVAGAVGVSGAASADEDNELAVLAAEAAAAAARDSDTAGAAAGPARAREGMRAGTVTIPGPPELLPGCPGAIVDLQTLEGAALVGGQWRYSDSQVHETGFVSVGPDLGPSGPPNRTYE